MSGDMPAMTGVSGDDSRPSPTPESVSCTSGTLLIDDIS
jgi:hypothetical protein